MAEHQGPDWARGLLAVGLLLLIVGAFTAWGLSLLGGLLIVFVGASTAGQRRESGKPPETLLDPGRGERPWKRRPE
ncbi:hypothetical protein [Streptomyces sp. NPDC048272]|uniref:hypothetical protein n=1 Tax=Streptomyces sp. NPDC048272 TaxID=3154616 RepID=UPI00341B5621